MKLNLCAITNPNVFASESKSQSHITDGDDYPLKELFIKMKCQTGYLSSVTYKYNWEFQVLGKKIVSQKQLMKY